MTFFGKLGLGVTLATALFTSGMWYGRRTMPPPKPEIQYENKAVILYGSHEVEQKDTQVKRHIVKREAPPVVAQPVQPASTPGCPACVPCIACPPVNETIIDEDEHTVSNREATQDVASTYESKGQSKTPSYHLTNFALDFDVMTDVAKLIKLRSIDPVYEGGASIRVVGPWWGKVTFDSDKQLGVGLRVEW